VNTWIYVVYMWLVLVHLMEVPWCYGRGLGTSRCIRGLLSYVDVCALVCRELELAVWVMWRPCEVDVRCHPDVRVLNAALCGAYYSEQRCGCAVPDLEWSVIWGGFLCCRVKRSVLVRCLFGVDVWNFQEVRLLDAVMFKNWQWTVKCIVRWRILCWILLSDCPCVYLGWMFTVYSEYTVNIQHPTVNNKICICIYLFDNTYILPLSKFYW